MFSPATKKPNFSSRKPQNSDSPITPLAENRRLPHDNPIPDRPTTGTPAPWAPRLSVLARMPPVKKSEKGDDVDSIKPVYVGEFPQEVRDEQAILIQKHIPGDFSIFGGIDRSTSLFWIICGNKLFIWSYLSSTASRKCIVLELPSFISEDKGVSKNTRRGSSWLVCVVNWHDKAHRNANKGVKQLNSVGIVMCDPKTQNVIYWPNIYSEGGTAPVTSLAERECGGPFNSLIASAIPDDSLSCVALACSSNGELWQFSCGPTSIHRKRIYLDIMDVSSQGSDSGGAQGSKGYPRSMVWRFPLNPPEESSRQFFLLTDHEIQCLGIKLSHDFNVAKLWSHEIVGTDGDLGIKKDLAGQKRIWPLDLQVDDRGKVITIIVATLCKDRVSSSNYMQYSLLTMQYKSEVNGKSELMNSKHQRVLEKKAPIQVIIPKARVEDEDFLFSMKLRVGGKPSGSSVILSGDGTGTVSHYYGNSTLLYQFDLPYDGGKVLDSSAFPSANDVEESSWIVLTEKAGVWAIPEKAVLLGGVEPPERSLSRKGSSNEGAAREERRNLTFAAHVAPRRVNSDAAWDSGEKQRVGFTGVPRRSAQDEESEALLGHIFQDFVLSGQVDGSLEKLRNAGAFEKDGETNVFARMSKSIVDTLAKHWTTTRGAEILAMAVVSTQLIDKQQKHEKFLQFLALSKCHEELRSRQKHSLQAIMEHGEKLAGMIQLRELQNTIFQNRSTGPVSQFSNSESELCGSLWDLIQLVGERARRNTVLLMDRDNAEVFYSKVSDLEQVFSCLGKQLEHLVSIEQRSAVAQIQRACELSDACMTLIHSAVKYRDEHQKWYPSPEELTSWCSHPVVRNGLWSIASSMLEVLNGTNGIDASAKSDLCSHLEVLTDGLLEAYTGAITAKVERGEEHKGLLEEYWNRRDALLETLYQQVKDLAEAEYQSLVGRSGEPNDILRNRSSNALAIARRHGAYQTLWNICFDLNDPLLLRNLMHESMGFKGGFSYFVFNQLHVSKQFSKLLRLGEEFPEELSVFLNQHRDLQWLHEIYLHQFSSASKTLHGLAFSDHDISVSVAEEGMDLDYAKPKATLVERKRLLNLSKIAAIAGKDDEHELRVKRIDADLKILKVQEEITKLIPKGEEKQNLEHYLLPPSDLIEHCLKEEAPLQAFQVFAWTSSSFRKSNRTLLEDCWKSATTQDDWGKLHQASMAEGWIDEVTLQHLKETVLFQASSRCYGPQADTFEGGFDEVLPLRQDDNNNSDESNSYSVETILRQHKDFAEAGKLMLTAIMLASVGEESSAPTLME